MLSPAEIAKGIVSEWFHWADRGMFIGHCDKKALQRLEEAIAAGIEHGLKTHQEVTQVNSDLATKPKRKPKGEAA